MRILVAGASGYIGSALRRRLRNSGHQVIQLVRRPTDAPDQVYWRPSTEGLEPSVLDGAAAVINLAGADPGGKRWTPEYKRLLRASRVNPTEALARAIAAAADPPGVLINASAVGYYGECGDTEVTEASGPGQGYFAELVQAWEQATEPASDAGARVVCLRSGLVIGAGSGLLKPMFPLFKMGLGGRLGSGRQWMPWISLADELAAIEFLLGADQVAGPVNLCGPAPVRNAEFAAAFGRAVHRPAVLPVPAFALRLVLGEVAEVGLVSQRVLPAVLTGAGFAFQHRELAAAFADALHR
jgi:uncharacterized protein